MVLKNKTIAIIEDDPDLLRLSEMLLTSEGYTCLSATDGNDAITLIEREIPDLVLLDIMLPGTDGIKVCREIRTFYSNGIIMLTGVLDDISELSSLRMGADDYIRKPIRPHILLARIESVLNRINQNSLNTDTSATIAENHQSIGSITLDRKNRVVLTSTGAVDFTSGEYDVLELLARHIGEIVSRDECLQTIRGIDYDGNNRSIDMRILSLRKKLAKLNNAPTIHTVRSRGYLLRYSEQ